jgi:hypothetical protein
MILESSSLGAIDIFLVLMVAFLVDYDHDVCHENHFGGMSFKFPKTFWQQALHFSNFSNFNS